MRTNTLSYQNHHSCSRLLDDQKRIFGILEMERGYAVGMTPRSCQEHQGQPLNALKLEFGLF